MAAPDLCPNLRMGAANPRSLARRAGVKSAGRHIILGQFSTKRIKSESKSDGNGSQNEEGFRPDAKPAQAELGRGTLQTPSEGTQFLEALFLLLAGRNICK